MDQFAKGARGIMHQMVLLLLLVDVNSAPMDSRLQANKRQENVASQPAPAKKKYPTFGKNSVFAPDRMITGYFS